MGNDLISIREFKSLVSEGDMYVIKYDGMSEVELVCGFMEFFILIEEI